MPEPRDILNDFPELKFPGDRAMLTIKEIARKMRCSDEKIFRLCDDGSLTTMALTGRNTKQERAHVRIPVNSYYAFLRRRMSAGWTPKHEPDPKQPDLPGIN